MFSARIIYLSLETIHIENMIITNYYIPQFLET